MFFFTVPRTWNIYDLAMFKWSAIVFGMLVGAYASPIVKSYVWLFVVVFLLLAAKPLIKYFKELGQ